MQVDFHYSTAYVVARKAGFSLDDADIIAYASQYVADAATTGTVCLDGRTVYEFAPATRCRRSAPRLAAQ